MTHFKSLTPFSCRLIIISLFIGFFSELAIIPLYAREAQPLTLNIVRAMWDDGSGMTDAKRIARNTVAAFQGVEFHLDIQWEEAQLADLQAAKKLPLKAQWLRDDGNEPSYVTDFNLNEQSMVVPFTPLTQMNNNQVEQMVQTVTVTRATTQLSEAQNNKVARWTVRIIYADDQPVSCERRPVCEYRVWAELPAIRAVWASRVDAQQPAGDWQVNAIPIAQRETPPNMPRGDVCLWISIRGDQMLLDELEKPNRLPLRHRWSRFDVGRSLGFEFQFVKDVMPPDVTNTSDLLARLRQELGEKGFFELRVWSSLRNANAGFWQIDTVFANGRPLMCQNNIPCSYRVLVGNNAPASRY